MVERQLLATKAQREQRERIAGKLRRQDGDSVVSIVSSERTRIVAAASIPAWSSRSEIRIPAQRALALHPSTQAMGSSTSC